jgi:hypothetical protein
MALCWWTPLLCVEGFLSSPHCTWRAPLPPSLKVREINIMLCLKHENIVEVQEMVPPLLVFLPLAFSPLFHLFFVTFPLPSPPLILLLYTFVLFDLFFLLPPLSKTRWSRRVKIKEIRCGSSWSWNTWNTTWKRSTLAWTGHTACKILSYSFVFPLSLFLFSLSTTSLLL